jgi:hypothetical protein
MSVPRSGHGRLIVRALRRCLPLVAIVGLSLALYPASSAALSKAPSLRVRIVATPSSFSAGDTAGCTEGPHPGQLCDMYNVVVTNIGGATTEGPIEVVEEFGPGLARSPVPSGEELTPPSIGTCEPATLSCTITEALIPGGRDVIHTNLVVSPGAQGPVTGKVTVSGGGSEPTASEVETPLEEATTGLSVDELSFATSREDGSTADQAGEHPAALSLTMGVTNSYQRGRGAVEPLQPKESIRALSFYLPDGFIGDPQSLPKCDASDFRATPGGFIPLCPAASQIGLVSVGSFGALVGLPNPSSLDSHGIPVYNLEPEKGYPAEFGFLDNGLRILMYASVVRRDGTYRLRVSVPAVPRTAGLFAVDATFFGTPAEHVEIAGEPFSRPFEPFLTDPASCTAGARPLEVELDTWEHPDRWLTHSTQGYEGLEGCGQLRFGAALKDSPQTEVAEQPGSYELDVDVARSPNQAPVLSNPPIKDISVNFPAGVAISPAAAAGQEGCSSTGAAGFNLDETALAESGLPETASGRCPAASQLAKVELVSPLLSEPLVGHIFLANPGCGGVGARPCTQADAEDGALFGLYLEAEASQAGVIIKLEGKATIDAAGRLSASFEENPQFPLGELSVLTNGGPRAPLSTPRLCGSYTTQADIEPWSAPETPDATPSGTFATTGPAGGGSAACAQTVRQLTNQPRFNAGMGTPVAGAFGEFTLNIERPEGGQWLRGLETTLPAGLLARIAGVEQCSEARIGLAEDPGRSGQTEVSTPACPAGSEVGSVEIAAGPGPQPLRIQGHAYLAGPYKGAPLSLAIVTPAVAGPFDLGTVLTRVALYVDEGTAQVHAVADPIPTVLAGVQLDIRSIGLHLDRRNFTVNPTNCAEKAIVGTSVSETGQSAPLRGRFQVTVCRELNFKPALKLFLSGQTKRTGNPALKAVLTQPEGQNANIAGTSVILPKGMLIANAHINDPCTRVQFNSTSVPGEGCPANSVLGSAKVWTPLLERPEEGKVYFRSNGGERELPDLVVALRGQIPVQLVGFIDSVGRKHAEVRRVRTRFQSVPDAPLSRFELSLYGGRKGLLENSKNLCKAGDRATFALTGQNGKTYDTEPKIQISCGKHRKKQHKPKPSTQLGASDR